MHVWKEYYMCHNKWVTCGVLWRTCWGNTLRTLTTDWRHDGNLLGTSKEQGKTEKYPLLNPRPQTEKCKAPLACARAFPLAAGNFSSQKSSSPFLARPLLPTSITFFFVEFDWPMSKSWNPEASQKFEDSMDRWSASPFRPPIYVRRGGFWTKHMGLKQGAIEKTHGERIGNLLEQMKKHKNLFAPPFKTLKPQKIISLLCIFSFYSVWSIFRF